MYILAKRAILLQDKYHMTNSVCFKVIYFKPHVFVCVRAFPTWSISCEMSGQTWRRRWPAPLRDVSPRQRMFVETKSRGEDRRGKTGEEEEEENEEQVVIYVSVDCWLTLAVSHSLFSLRPSLSAIYLSVLSLLLAIIVWSSHSGFLLQTRTQTPPCELGMSACTDKLPLSP